jgi:hypothetical protein
MDQKQQIAEYLRLQEKTLHETNIYEAAALADRMADSPTAAIASDLLSRLEKIRELSEFIVGCDAMCKCDNCAAAAKQILDLTDLDKPLQEAAI